MKRLVAASLVFALILAPAGLQGAEKAKAKAKAKPVKKTVVPGAKAPAFSVLNAKGKVVKLKTLTDNCLLYTSPSPRDRQKSRMPSSA